ncbi:extracellular solute-binding protein [Halopiger djelfimassiliensis]|uniref:extracellular solute-binding protein n=1 Tax=Halopiger djelfimassiliensis TaxID=1293047 RepID=UPI000677CA7F|nr:extracellular solute-binding protein [Halopiger djelfimassiliensis]
MKERGTHGLSRRTLLGVGGAAVATGLAGCIYHGPFKYTRLDVSVRESFESEPPVSVPLTVDVTVQNVDSKDVALRGVELVCYDAAREELASETLGDFDWRETTPEQRERTDHDTGWTQSTVTAYSADWTVDTSLEVDAVPEWLSFRVAEVWFGEDRDPERSAIVGTARASQPPPALTATIRRFEGTRPPPSTVGPDQYRSERVRSRRVVDTPLLPPPSPVTFWHARDADRLASLEADVDAFVEDSTSVIDPVAVSDPGEATIDALEDYDSDGPHLVEIPHPLVADFDDRGHLSDQTAALEIRRPDAFIDPAAEAGVVNGRTVGVPCTLETVALLYDRNRLPEPPETVAELTAIAERHRDTKAEPDGASSPSVSLPSASAWVHAFGGYYYDAASDSLGLTEPETIRAVEFVAENLAPYSFHAPDRPDEQADAFVAGRTPVAIGDPARAARAAATGIDVGAAPLPNAEAAPERPSPFVTVDLLAFTSRLSEPSGRDAVPAATAFAAWYTTNAEIHVRNASTHGTVPAYTAAADSGDLPASVAGFVKSAATGTLAPPASAMRAISQPLQTAFESILAGEQSAATALEAAETRIEAERNPSR